VGSQLTCCSHHASPISSHRHLATAPLRDVVGIGWERDRIGTSVWGSSAEIGCMWGWFLSFLQRTIRLIVLCQTRSIRHQRINNTYTLLLLHVLKINQHAVDPRPAFGPWPRRPTSQPCLSQQIAQPRCYLLMYRHDTPKRYRRQIVSGPLRLACTLRSRALQEGCDCGFTSLDRELRNATYSTSIFHGAECS